MTNKEFEETKLNPAHIRFYRETVLLCFSQRLTQSEISVEKLSKCAIEDAQELMKSLGYAGD